MSVQFLRFFVLSISSTPSETFYIQSLRIFSPFRKKSFGSVRKLFVQPLGNFLLDPSATFFYLIHWKLALSINTYCKCEWFVCFSLFLIYITFLIRILFSRVCPNFVLFAKNLRSFWVPERLGKLLDFLLLTITKALRRWSRVPPSITGKHHNTN